MYYLPLPLDGLLDAKYVKHFNLLSSASYTLSKDKIWFVEIKTVHLQLEQFLNEFEVLYGKTNVTMNIEHSSASPFGYECMLRRSPMDKICKCFWNIWWYSDSSKQQHQRHGSSACMEIHNEKTINKPSTDEKICEPLSVIGSRTIKISSEEMNLFVNEGSI